MFSAEKKQRNSELSIPPSQTEEIRIQCSSQDFQWQWPALIVESELARRKWDESGSPSLSTASQQWFLSAHQRRSTRLTTQDRQASSHSQWFRRQQVELTTTSSFCGYPAVTYETCRRLTLLDIFITVQ